MKEEYFFFSCNRHTSKGEERGERDRKEREEVTIFVLFFIQRKFLGFFPPQKRAGSDSFITSSPK